MATICRSIFLTLSFLTPFARADERQLLDTYCFPCHHQDVQEGGLNLKERLATKEADWRLVFENIATQKMPPKDAAQPEQKERRALLAWLAERENVAQVPGFRRRSRHEFVHAVNDLLKIERDITNSIPEDRGTKTFDTDRRISFSRESMSRYFSAADTLLGFALPGDGFFPERIWVTNRLKPCHPTYNIYVRNTDEGKLFSWTRANNGNSYSFFYDGFEPHVAGWYELTFAAHKVGEFPEDVSLQVHTGRYYFADDRPQPQRLLGVISLSNRKENSFRLRAFLHPGENVSVHCYSKHTFRKPAPTEGAHIRQLTVRGPVFKQWPPPAFHAVFGDLPVIAPPREPQRANDSQTELQKIGGSLSVSSFQNGMEKEHMQDGSTKTFWHTRFTPTVADPPHYVVVENPQRKNAAGLMYSTWSGGNGNGQVKSFEISTSEDGKTWSEPIVRGNLVVKLAAPQPIEFPSLVSSPHIRFLVTDAVSLDGKSLASIGQLDVLLPATKKSLPDNLRVTINANSANDLKDVLNKFARRAFGTELKNEDIQPYFHVARNHFRDTGNFVEAAKAGLKAVICSPRFLMIPGEHTNASYRRAAELAQILWLSVPDAPLLELAKSNTLSGDVLRQQIHRMLADKRSDRMVKSLCDQWLNLRMWNTISPSLKLYPRYDDLLHHFLPRETRAYLADMIRRNLPVRNLIDSDYSFLNQRLAQHYKIPNVTGQQLRKVSIPEDVPRGGLLTMGSILRWLRHVSHFARGVDFENHCGHTYFSPAGNRAGRRTSARKFGDNSATTNRTAQKPRCVPSVS